jgi:formate hydrogenlyase subunit 3/multisubunit Na+/H+ antiporter MnhD subunit
MIHTASPPLIAVLGVMAFWLLLGVAGLARIADERFVFRLLFPLGSVGGVVLVVCGLAGLSMPPSAAVIPLGLPDLPFHFRLDELSSFFVLLLGIASTAISQFSAGYFRRTDVLTPGLTCLQFHLFLAGMLAVFLADDGYLFMVAWETMALSSYFLVTTDHRHEEIRRAGLLYLIVAHIGAVAILMAFGVMQNGAGDYTFATMREAGMPPFWATVVFLLALLGFGAKAGFVPLHAWLPEAHPAAPSPVSALMSGVMLKTAIYGLLRVTFDLLPMQIWWWGVLALGLGLVTALLGVMFAAVQTDMKRLLAYSSIENLGIVLTGVGLTILFNAYGMHALAALALVATLYHCLNHACFKSLLFLTTGSVLHATQQRGLGHLGGLIRRMPWVSVFALIGVLAIAGLPPLNGFVSEWLLLQAFLLTPGLPNSYLNMLVPVATAAVVLASALAAYVMVKFYGVVFLGQPREEKLREAHDAGYWERAAFVWLATACVLLGLAPVAVIGQLDAVSARLVGDTLTPSIGQSGWLFLTPASAERASYSAPVFAMGIVAFVLVTFVMVRRVYHGRVRRAPAWDCGYPGLTPRMQDTAEGFGQPIKQIFEPFFRIERHMPTPFDERPQYWSRTEDRLWFWFYRPIVRAADWVSSLVAVLHHGRIHLYLIYSFVTLLALLLIAR